ncbi:MAG: 6-phospho-3-hexuloisomerase [Sphaerochaetaceae bacterium]
MSAKNFHDVSSSIMMELTKCLDTISSEEIESLIAKIKQSHRIFCFGVGRSGIILRSFCMRLNHLGLDSYYLGSIQCPPATKDDLLLLVSGSGETGSVLAYANQARDIGCSLACITANRINPLIALAEVVINVKAPSSLINTNSGSKQPMRSLFEQGAFIICETLLLMLQSDLCVSELDMARRHANIV